MQMDLPCEPMNTYTVLCYSEVRNDYRGQTVGASANDFFPVISPSSLQSCPFFFFFPPLGTSRGYVASPVRLLHRWWGPVRYGASI